jgi:hypothetical protein
VNLDQIPTYCARKIRQVSECRDNADFTRMSRHQANAKYPDQQDD